MASTPANSSPVLDRPLARFIDHTLLKPDAPTEALYAAVDEAAALGVAAACIPPYAVADAARRLEGTDTAVCTVIGFPLGWVDPRVRIEESRRAVDDGARELDTVLNLSLVKGGHLATAQRDLAGWVDALRDEHGDALVLKVILETALLEPAEVEAAARLSVEAGVDFLKTSTGFSTRGASLEDVERLVRVAGGRARVKASGGIRDLDTALAMIAAGAERLGTSSGAVILAEAAERGLV